MKAVIFAGGFGTRISEETSLIPKPMIQIGGKPILWHIMKIYSHYGIKDFIVCTGYKEYVIKEYFANYFIHNSDVTFNLAENSLDIHRNFSDNWKVTVVNTGLNTMTGGRLKRIYEYVKNEEHFFLTYGDGVSDINISELLKFHKNHGKLATLTAIKPVQQFGIIDVNEKTNLITSFIEKPEDREDLVNGGFFVISPKVIEKYIENDQTIFEKDPLQNLVNDRELAAFRHFGFWKCMDTLRDKNLLEEMWESGKAKWKVW